MAIAVNVDGRLCGEHDAVVSVFDHGFLFGEGVYEVMRTYGGEPFLFDRHVERLRASADRIALQSRSPTMSSSVGCAARWRRPGWPATRISASS